MLSRDYASSTGEVFPSMPEATALHWSASENPWQGGLLSIVECLACNSDEAPVMDLERRG